MSKTVRITGRFLDPSQNPLSGTIAIAPYRRYIVQAEADTVYGGPIIIELAQSGEIDAQMIATEGWEYEATFNLQTGQGYKVDINPVAFTVAEDQSLPDLMEMSLRPGSREPIIIKQSYISGELNIYGATLDPEDPGAILLPAATI